MRRGTRGRWAVRWRGAFVAGSLAVGGPVVGQQLPDADRLLAAELPEVWRVGAMEGAVWETFGRLSAAAFGPDGRLYLLDGLRRAVVVFDARGEFLHEIGGPGEGPGEFGSASELAVLADGTVVVGDLRRRTLHLFEPDGAYRDAIRLEAGGFFRMEDLHASPRDATFFQGGGRTVSMSISQGADPAEMRRRPILEVDPSRGAVATFYQATMPEPREAPGDAFSSTDSGPIRLNLSAAIPPTWQPQLWVAPLPDGGLAVVESAEWEVRLLSPSAAVRTTLARPNLRPTPVTEEMAERDRDRRRREFQASGGGDMIEEMSIESGRYWHEIPVIAEMRGSPEGVLWVERSPEWPDGEVRVDVVRWDGSYLGTLATPFGLPDAFGPDGVAVWIEQDEFGVQRAVVRRIPPELR